MVQGKITAHLRATSGCHDVESIAIPVGAFADPNFPQPVLSVYEERMHPWVVLPAGIENPKGELQELLQARSPVAPVYQTISAEGPDHDRQFVCAVLHDGVELARGSGKSKKTAESDAALAALNLMRANLENQL